MKNNFCLKKLLIRITTISLIAFCAASANAKDENAPNQRPVKVIADQRLTVTTAQGVGQLPLYASQDLQTNTVHADINRAVLVFHGRLRDADVYWRSAQAALSAAGDSGKGTLLIVPQFLAERDVSAHNLNKQTLAWGLESWMGGEPALSPAPISSFDAIDAILSVLADKKIYPNLKQVVVAGHSGGAQVVQRYAVVGQGEFAITQQAVQVRYVIANPSSYLYFSNERPNAQGLFSLADASACPMINQWKYGWEVPPPYAKQFSPKVYEEKFYQRDVIYLLGTKDTNPNHPALDKTCAAEAQGAYRYIRGKNYLRYLNTRKPKLAQQQWDVLGVGHEGEKMLDSACGVAAMFDDAKAKVECMVQQNKF